MAPCKGQCWFCPLKKPIKLTDRWLRATYFAAICVKAAMPGRHPNLDCMINCVAMARDVSELLNCGEDLHDLWYWTVHKSERERPVAKRLDQGARIFSLFSSFATIGSLCHDYSLINMGNDGGPMGDLSRALSVAGHACTLGSLLTANASDADSLTDGLTAISEGSYMTLEFFMERTSIPVRGAIGISTAAWGILT